MSLHAVLWIKICCSLVLWCVPLLLFPARWFTWFGMPAPRPMLFGRLLGAAFAALVPGYGLGLYDLYQNQAVTEAVRNVVWVGIVSNGLACLVLVVAGNAGVWDCWGRWARGTMWLSAGLTGAITPGLVWTGLYQHP